MKLFDKPLFTFEMANNHQGSVEHGLNIIDALGKIIEPYRDVFDFAVKFQYRDLDTFIRPDYINRDDIKNVKRFNSTRLSEEQFLVLKAAVEEKGMYTICTPFDERSVDTIIRHNYDIVKIASCSFADWPLMEKIVTARKPVIASTASSSLENIDRVVSFFRHRNIELALMHCVAEYPTTENNLQMNQIDLLKERYKGIRIGFSTHEEPADMDPIKVAVAKHADIFERHVGLETETVSLNKYSSTPEQIAKWLESALKAYRMCGVAGRRYVSSDKEKADLLSLQRGVFLRRSVKKGEYLTENDVYFAFPCENGQLLSSNMSKYANIVVNKDIDLVNTPVYLTDVTMSDKRGQINRIIEKVFGILKKGHVVVPVSSKCDISHHYGIDKFEEIGTVLIDYINREYCKKYLVMLPGQKHPSHFHKEKEETFIVLYGQLDVVYNGQRISMHRGDAMTIERGVPHSFSSPDGSVFEEISTTHIKDDSYYDNYDEFVSPRKTSVYLTGEMVSELNRD